ncbi:MAG TPA: SDR family oxidoreductase [Oxalicibacterium sp.]|nr:SDR family oxidoreductase [Oxalicibacterium sp.]
MKTVQVAIVTGASRGIGAEIAKHLARDGYQVIVNYASNAAEADKVVQEISSAGGKALAVKANVADAGDVAALFDAAEQAFGKVDVLINNAGVMPPELPMLADTDDKAFDTMMAINLKGTFNTLRQAARRMAQGGRIVNFSTSIVGLALPGYSIYGATKAAVETMSQIFAKELRGRGIRVNVVAPGPTATALFLDGKSPERIETLSKMAPLERLGRPDDIAKTVSFLVGEQSAWVNGQTLRVNGGIV